MKMRSVVVLSAAMLGLSVSSSVYAAPLRIAAPLRAMFGKPKTVRFNLCNDTGLPLELKVGEGVMTVGAGKTVAMKLPAGTRVLTNAANAKHQAGELLTEVGSQLDDATVRVR